MGYFNRQALRRFFERSFRRSIGGLLPFVVGVLLFWTPYQLFSQSQAITPARAPISVAPASAVLANSLVCNILLSHQNIISQMQLPKVQEVIVQNAVFEFYSVMLNNVIELPLSLGLGKDRKVKQSINQVTLVVGDGYKKIFKPQEGEVAGMFFRFVVQSPFGQTSREILQTKLADALGVDFIAHGRRATVNGRNGVLVDFVEGVTLHDLNILHPKLLEALLKQEKYLYKRAMLRLFDFLAGHMDRHLGNIILSELEDGTVVTPENLELVYQKILAGVEVKKMVGVDGGLIFDKMMAIGARTQNPLDRQVFWFKKDAEVKNYSRSDVGLFEALPPDLQNTNFIQILKEKDERFWRELIRPSATADFSPFAEQDVLGFLDRRQALIEEYTGTTRYNQQVQEMMKSTAPRP